MAAFPADWGREQLVSLEFIDRAEDLVLYGDVGCGKTHLAIAIGTLCVCSMELWPVEHRVSVQLSGGF